MPSRCTTQMEITGMGAFIAEKHLQVAGTLYLIHANTCLPTECLEEPWITWIVRPHAYACFSVIVLSHRKARAIQDHGGSGSSYAIPALTTTH